MLSVRRVVLSSASAAACVFANSVNGIDLLVGCKSPLVMATPFILTNTSPGKTFPTKGEFEKTSFTVVDLPSHLRPRLPAGALMVNAMRSSSSPVIAETWNNSRKIGDTGFLGPLEA
jgi:hypothetical protein